MQLHLILIAGSGVLISRKELLGALIKSVKRLNNEKVVIYVEEYNPLLTPPPYV